MRRKDGDAGKRASTKDLDAELERAMSDLAHIKAYYAGDPAGRQLGKREDASDGAGARGQDARGVEASSSGADRTASPDKLSVAEAVIRKLYKRNLELETTLKDIKEHSTKRGEAAGLAGRPEPSPSPTPDGPETDSVGRASRQSAASEPTHAVPLAGQSPEAQLRANSAAAQALAGSGAGALPEMHSQAEQQLLLMIETRDHTIAELKRTVQELNARVLELKRAKGLGEEGASRSEVRRAKRRQKELEGDLRESQTRLEYYIQQLEAMRVSQAARLQTKNDHKKMGQLLAQQMDSQQREHERERARFSAKLASLEEEASELYVQNRMFESQLSKVSEELRQRDAVEAQIQEQVYALFTHMKELEAENMRLRKGAGSAALSN